MRLTYYQRLKLAALLILPLLPAGGRAQQAYRQLTDVPTIYIETENGRSITSKEDYIGCRLVMVDGGEVTTFDNTLIRGRGNSTWWNSDKKPYRVKFGEKQRLLGQGFANARSWPLLANHGDKTMIRNALTYDLGRFVGMAFCPGARFVDLCLNGSYRGTYQISDQVQVHKKRVEIDEADGWLIEVANENSHEQPYFTTRRGIMYNIKNPKDELLTYDKRTAIEQWVQQMEDAVFSSDFGSERTGYKAYIDERDLVNWYVAAEITGNIDALYSIYMYKDKDEERIHFGPLWDLDLGYDNSSEKSLLRNMEAYLGLWNRPFEKVIQRLWEDPWFARACNERLHELVDAGLQRYLTDHIDSLRNVVYQTQERNFSLWPIHKQVYSWERHVYHNTYDEYIADLKGFVNDHIPYLVGAFDRLYQTTTLTPAGRGEPAADGPVYNASGQQVRDMHRHGLYIRNGKKVLK